MRRVFVDREAPQRDAIEEAATWIRRGGVIAIPTETLYGLAADPFNRSAVARVFEVKGRSGERALPLLAASVDQVAAHIGPLDGIAARLAARFWPGALTILMPAPLSMASGVTGGTGKVGVRVPADPIARAVCAAAARPITATSANVSGAPATADPGVVEQTLGDRIDYLLDTGATPGGAPSTIVDVAEGADGRSMAAREAVRLVRAGAIPWDEIEAWLQHA